MKGRDWSGFWLAPASRIFASRCWQPYSYRPSVGLSVVCLSVTFMRPTQTVQIFGNISTALGTLATR